MAIRRMLCRVEAGMSGMTASQIKLRRANREKIPAPPFELPPWQCSNETRLLLVQRQRHAALHRSTLFFLH